MTWEHLYKSWVDILSKGKNIVNTFDPILRLLLFSLYLLCNTTYHIMQKYLDSLTSLSRHSDIIGLLSYLCRVM